MESRKSLTAVIITPAYSHTHHLLDAAVARSGLGWRRRFEHADLPRVRSVLFSEAYDSGEDVIVAIDADIVPEDGCIEAAAAMATPGRAVFGVYPLRGGQRLSVEPKDPQATPQAVKAAEAFPIFWGGLGLAAFHRESLTRVIQQLEQVDELGHRWWPVCVPFVEGTKYYGDDMSLCARLRRVDVELFAAPTLRLHHVVQHPLAARWSV